MEALLRVKDLSIDIHRGKQVFSSVEGISFDVFPGEILGIVGESGSGKTLTALSIPGLLGENKKTSSGSILYNPGDAPEMDLLSLSPAEMEKLRGKEISMIFQESHSALNPLLRAGAQIAEALQLHSGENMNKGRINAQARELLKRLKFADPERVMNTWPHRLSGGMCQRVMIAIAVICQPRLLVADEPTTALDQNTQDEIAELLKEINREFSTSILFISHDISLIRRLCGRVLVMYSGRILEEGDTEEVFSHPAHEYTRGLLASIPSEEAKGKDLISISGKIPSLEEGRPGACPFHPRCGKALPECGKEFPPEKIIADNHKTRCILGAAE